MVDFVADTFSFVASVYGAKATRSTMSTFNKVDRVECNFIASVYRALECRGNNNATLNNTKLVNWPLMGELLHLVQRGGTWAGPCHDKREIWHGDALPRQISRLDSKGNYSATSNNTKLVHWPLMGGLLHLVNMVQREGAWTGCGPAQVPPRCTKCNSPPINGQCTNHRTAV